MMCSTSPWKPTPELQLVPLVHKQKEWNFSCILELNFILLFIIYFFFQKINSHKQYRFKKHKQKTSINCKKCHHVFYRNQILQHQKITQYCKLNVFSTQFFEVIRINLHCQRQTTTNKKTVLLNQCLT